MSVDIADGWESIQREVNPEQADNELHNESEEEPANAAVASISSLALDSICSTFNRYAGSALVNNTSDPMLGSVTPAPGDPSERPHGTVIAYRTAEGRVIGPYKKPELGLNEKLFKEEVRLQCSDLRGTVK